MSAEGFGVAERLTFCFIHTPEIQIMNESEPLGLPRGSVRAILACAVIGGTIGLYGLTGHAPDWLISAFGTAFGFYFGSRSVK